MESLYKFTNCNYWLNYDIILKFIYLYMSIQTQQFPKNFHFGGGAWASSFHIGVVKALEEQWEDDCVGEAAPRLPNQAGEDARLQLLGTYKRYTALASALFPALAPAPAPAPVPVPVPGRNV